MDWFWSGGFGHCAFLSLLGMIGLVTSPLWAWVFVIGVVVLIVLGIVASRVLRWPAALAGVIVCVCASSGCCLGRARRSSLRFMPQQDYLAVL